MMVRVHIKKLSPKALIPFYATAGSAGFDLASIDDIEIPPGWTTLVHTGLAVAIPFGYELQIRPRSGTSLKTGCLIKNSPGTIDSDYRGEIGIIVHNVGTVPLKIAAGDRIAQGVVTPVYQARFFEVKELDETERGSSGFGSTGSGSEAA